MGRRFLLVLFILSAFLIMLHTSAAGSPTDSDTYPLHLRYRSLLENPERKGTTADQPSEKDAPLEEEKGTDEERETPAEAPTEWESRKMGKHHESDKSVAGGGVIIGGLVTAIFAAVYCYIRVTRKRPTEASI